MRVQVDESRSHDQSRGVDRVASGSRLFRYRRDLAVQNSDVAHGVEPGVRVHDATVQDHGVVGAPVSCGAGGGEGRDEDYSFHSVDHWRNFYMVCWYVRLKCTRL
jgi:hypothetical protein